MCQRHYILVLCLTILGGSLAAKFDNDRSARKVPELPADQANENNVAGFIDIDNPQIQPYQEGSAYSEMDDEDMYNSGFGDDEDMVGSGGKDKAANPIIREHGQDGNGVDGSDHSDPNEGNGKEDPEIHPEDAKDDEDKPGDGLGDGTDGSDGTKQELVHKHNSIFGHPGILAGIVGGAVVGLLCAVLLVMFIVYRMRKKDEGSYALDEPKRSPSHSYTRAPTKEFYA